MWPKQLNWNGTVSCKLYGFDLATTVLERSTVKDRLIEYTSRPRCARDILCTFDENILVMP